MTTKVVIQLQSNLLIPFMSSIVITLSLLMLLNRMTLSLLFSLVCMSHSYSLVTVSSSSPRPRPRLRSSPSCHSPRSLSSSCCLTSAARDIGSTTSFWRYWSPASSLSYASASSSFTSGIYITIRQQPLNQLLPLCARAATMVVSWVGMVVGQAAVASTAYSVAVEDGCKTGLKSDTETT